MTVYVAIRRSFTLLASHPEDQYRSWMSHFRLFLGLGKAPALLKVERKNVGFEMSVIKSAKMGQLLNTK